MPRTPVQVTTTMYCTSIDEVFHPEAAVDLGDLMGPEGNAHVVLGRVTHALKDAGIDPSEYLAAAKAKDYEHLLFVTRATLRVFESGPGRPQDS